MTLDALLTLVEHRCSYYCQDGYHAIETNSEANASAEAMCDYMRMVCKEHHNLTVDVQALPAREADSAVFCAKIDQGNAAIERWYSGKAPEGMSMHYPKLWIVLVREAVTP